MGLVFVLAFAGCGPVVLGVGANSVFSTDDPDLGEPAVEIEVQAADGRELDPPAFANQALLFRFRVNKPAVALSALVLGPIPPGTSAAALATIEADYAASGALPANAWSREFTQLSTIPSDNTALNGFLAGTADGVYQLVLRGADAQARSDSDTHTWIHDTLPPMAPRLASALANTPRALDLTWIVSQDPPGNPDAIASGIAEYRVYFDVGAATVPDAPRAAVPAFDGRAKFSMLEGGTGNSPVSVPATAGGTFRLTGLFAMRRHYLRVTAVDRAGNETDLMTAEEIATRTRAGADGTFAAALSMPSGPAPGALFTADFDRDGHLDLLVVDRIEASARVRFGVGDGTFTDAVVVEGGTNANAAAYALGDLNGDTHLDLFAPNRVNYGTGRRTDPFPPFSGGSTGASQSKALAVADLNGDGLDDQVVAAEFGLNAELFPAEAMFISPQQYFLDFDERSRFVDWELGSLSRCLALADLNGDDRLDVISCAAAAVAVKLGLGSFVWSAPRTYSSGGQPHSFTVADVNADGVPDVGVANADGTVAVLLGQPAGSLDGSFGAPQVTQLGSAVGRIAHGDFNGDGQIDFVTAGTIPGAVAVLLGDGTGALAIGSTALLSGTPRSIVTGDWNEDGIPDIAVSLDEGTVEVFLGNGASGASDLSFGLTFSAFGPVQSVDAGDFNGDGVVDLAASLGSRGVHVLLSRAVAGQSAGGFLSRVGFQATEDINAVFVADLDGDGDIDMVGHGGQLRTSIAQVVVPLLIGTGFGNFVPDEGFTDLAYFLIPDPDCLAPYPAADQFSAVGDFNGDGKDDFATITRSVTSNRGRGRTQQRWAVPREVPDRRNRRGRRQRRRQRRPPPRQRHARRGQRSHWPRERALRWPVDRSRGSACVRGRRLRRRPASGAPAG